MKPGILNFAVRLKKPAFGIDAVPFISIGLIVLLFLFAGNSLFISHGLSMDLIELPEQNLDIPSRPPDAVLTIYSSSVFFFEGQNLSSHSLEQAVSRFVREQSREEVLILVRANRILSLEQLSPILNTLEKAGVHRVILESQTTSSRFTPQ